MLRALAIRDFAIISEMELDLDAGFTAITGETGAGKSILVDALGQLLGDRAESALVAEGCRQADLSAVFDVEPGGRVDQWLAEQALDDNHELVVRRVLSADGGSRAWINGRSATVGQLSELGSLLVEIHGQHEHQQLEKPQTQRRLLDREIDPELTAAVSEAYRHWLDAQQALEAFETDAGDADQLELLRFQCRELNELDLAEGEYDSLSSEQERLARSDDIRLATGQASAALDQDDAPSVRSLLHEALTALEQVRGIEPRLAETATMLEEARINIDEAFNTLERLGDEETGDPQRLATVNRRLETALDLARKHRIQPEQIPELTRSLNQRLEALENQGERREELEKQLDRSEQHWRASAEKLSHERGRAAELLSSRVGECLAELGMEQASLTFTLETDPDAAPSRHGMDRIGIVFSANPGQPQRPLAKVASGGELSRVALAVMIATGGREGPQTRIFDEVDAGVGGETARVVGRFLRQAAGRGQALCVTHLPQVAACADHQVRVTKESENDAVITRVDRLDEPERKREIARMLGSAESEKSLAHAAEMLGKV